MSGTRGRIAYAATVVRTSGARVTLVIAKRIDSSARATVAISSRPSTATGWCSPEVPSSVASPARRRSRRSRLRLSSTREDRRDREPGDQPETGSAARTTDAAARVSSRRLAITSVRRSPRPHDRRGVARRARACRRRSGRACASASVALGAQVRQARRRRVPARGVGERAPALVEDHDAAAGAALEADGDVENGVAVGRTTGGAQRGPRRADQVAQLVQAVVLQPLLEQRREDAARRRRGWPGW